MAILKSRIMIASRTPNSKPNKKNSGRSVFSCMHPFDPADLEQRSLSYETTISHQHLHGSIHSRYNGHSGSDLRGNMPVQEAKQAVSTAERTTEKINDCLEIAEVIRGDASKTAVSLQQQGEQIAQTHQTAASMDRDLSKAEKILGSLGGLFAKRWKPKKSREIKGPILIRDDSVTRRDDHMVQRQKLEQIPPKPDHHCSAPLSALEKVQFEKAKQDDALSELSNLLDKLKAMAVDMGSEIDRQNKALDHMEGDVDELNIRVKGASLRARCLLRR